MSIASCAQAACPALIPAQPKPKLRDRRSVGGAAPGPLGQALAALRRIGERRRRTDRLAALGDHVLRDIGLGRHDVPYIANFGLAPLPLPANDNAAPDAA